MRKISALRGRPHRSWCAATLTLQMLVLTAPVTLALGPQLRGAHSAYAQSATTGAIRGVVRNAKTSEPLVGATVIATSPALQGNQSAVTDDNGEYLLTALPPGTYTVTTFYAEARIEQLGIAVRANVVVTSHASIKPEAMGAEPVIVRPSAPKFADGGCKGLPISKEVLATHRLPTATTEIPPTQLPGTTTQALVVGSPIARASGFRRGAYVVDSFRTTALNKFNHAGRLSAANLCFAGIGQCGR